MSRSTRVAALAGVIVLGGLGAAARAQAPAVVREGAGERRAALDAMELAPFPDASLGALTGWVGGKAVSSADMSGSVVLICTYSDWYDPARRAWAMAKRLGASKGKDGLVVIGAHHPEEWAAANKDLPKDARIFLAHDAKGEFRKALKSDQDPDFYVIDRAGQLRFADIETESVDNAVTQLLAETREQAAGLRSRMAADAAATDAQFRKSGAIRERVDLSTLPEVPFPDPPKEAYERAAWPRRPAREGAQDTSPRTIQLPGTGVYFPRPPVVRGRAIVIYVWNPDVRQSYEDVMPMMDRLQTQHGRDVAIVGAAVFTGRDQSGGGSIDPKEAMQKVSRFLKSRSFDHTITLYQEGMAGPSDSGSKASDGLAVVASSNGVIRWSGSPNSPGLRAALEQVIDADPGVKARREAEEAYLKAGAK